ncbi:monofunctional biosynthetic peptidoglycan transglycosylase [Shewanella amazonensis]|uniref:Biosynthetic peptidoglycan transglycosylase n=1 Tax=Shewanella amazonensis (strain ATCC BAA-1098 / SB2B) TaxID=326297 RepID=MTGA_SHEAM|nr:monofunctional biosynthetic peptidoglycan transglycosylase [Shewanella amazonensis]A1S3J2.1 RecName: Full=Biosynthetic peptidoglycan transglycosylase; AltName: Full=Glycan polymerase; AltName: Full=Peptidoglycan glycosyltransferase MtgA; Short=PGT [Shewanella amazonensis SB2B]ABL98948.1 monofunctional biosynthetic peptidoglycan transglycosylase [Shewanella amazonensis SB2B]
MSEKDLGGGKKAGFIARTWRGFWRWSARLLVAFLILSLVLVATVSVINPPTWAWRIDRALFPPKEDIQVRHQWVPLDKIAAHMQLAVIAAEDQRFTLHNGVDFAAIKTAIADRDPGEPLRGASTLTQQTAKNLFLWSSRSFVRKGLEAWFALLLDTLSGKRRTLELYLNIVEFGPGIYGVEAASRYYFNKGAGKLSTREAALLAALLPNPWSYRINPPTAYMNRRADWIARQMRQLGMATLKDLD